MKNYRWIPLRWFDLIENGKFGRDFLIQTAIKLSCLDLRKPISVTDSKMKNEL
jgi:hypothetical protein